MYLAILIISLGFDISSMCHVCITKSFGHFFCDTLQLMLDE